LRRSAKVSQFAPHCPAGEPALAPSIARAESESRERHRWRAPPPAHDAIEITYEDAAVSNGR